MLQDAGILVTLTLTQWQARKLDKAVSIEVCNNKGADTDSGNFKKDINPKIHLLKISKTVNMIRNFHRFDRNIMHCRCAKT